MGCCSSKGAIRKRAVKWKATGIVGLRDSRLKSIPSEVFEIAKVVRTLDASCNKIGELPLSIDSLHNLQRLILVENSLTRLPSTFVKLTSLKTLALDSNQLSELPDEIGLLVRLERLSIASNHLSSLPSSMGSLRNLVILDISQNQVKVLPESIGSCFSLEEIQASGNRIEQLPQSLSNLSHLKTLVLAENKISQLPSSLLKSCSALQTLSLHGNPITVEDLHRMDGFEEFEARRRKKVDKQLDTNVVTNSNFFDDGIDRNTT
ncbi:hypothetical protein SELMODRAFT_83151 [Selaginella moellendorffii]|uniref:Disease resistance R13L4/SHOC-2-like LRR domain-containing protein n=1 Tax=Selaginella moellendorffii TaxID=88036 RepID=D8R217_SELML|nr:plant intracellular Ras-group-related LRR protein 7 [Selaginella moellendorffii]EFJ33992.1 hypothetical protein SELMODRAFT_83151 [Selaginella moellendorffii]|eukprot:XP_002965154.1 plant intracellular Ras-group-related LRR protein 7 [Selaginella moellendorffii]